MRRRTSILPLLLVALPFVMAPAGPGGPPQMLWQVACETGETLVYDVSAGEWGCGEGASSPGGLAIRDAGDQEVGRFLGLRDEALGLYLTLLDREGRRFVMRLRNPEGIATRAFFGYRDPGTFGDPGIYFTGSACDGDVYMERQDVLGMNLGARAFGLDQTLGTWAPASLYASTSPVTVASRLDQDRRTGQAICDPVAATLDLIPAVRLAQDVGDVFAAPFRLVVQP